MLGAIEMRTKRHAVVRHFAQFAQAEHLVAARIGENRARPRHEFVQPAHGADQFVPGPKIEMIGIRKENLHAEIFEVLLRLPFTVAAVPTGMNAGVSITPCGVVSRPSRAPVGSVARISKRKFIRESVSGTQWRPMRRDPHTSAPLLQSLPNQRARDLLAIYCRRVEFDR